MEVSSSVQICNLGPCVGLDIIDFAFVHAFRRQAAANREDLTFVFFDKHARQSVRSPLEKHVSSLDEPFFNELVAVFCGLARFSTTCEKYAALFVFNAHKVGRDLDIYNIRPVAM